MSGGRIPKSESLLLHWSFDNVTGSGPSSDGSPTTSDAKFTVEDVSSGSLSLVGKYGYLGDARHRTYPGVGDFFLPNDVNVVNKEYIASAKQLPPEVINSSNLVEIRNEDDELFTKESRPVKHFYLLEKSPYAIISEEILKIFATIKDFNNLIGEPVNRYRQDYKSLEKLRNLYFDRINNGSIDFEKFVDYFKWFDSSISQILEQLTPASSRISPEIQTMVESHILERNKYWTKFPTLESKGTDDLESGFEGVNKLTYSWISGSAPVVKTQNDNQKLWWQKRAERTSNVLTSGKVGVDNSRSLILSSSVSELERKFTTYIKEGVKKEVFLTGSWETVKFSVLKDNRASRYISSSVRGAHVPLGNYSHDYQAIQTSGRSINNRYLIKSLGTGTIALSSFISGIVDYALPDRTNYKNKQIIVEKFAAPGGPEVMGRGSVDYLSEEFSIYNNINERNQIVKTALKTFEKTHTLKEGYSSVSSSIPNYHKSYRNPVKRIKINGTMLPGDQVVTGVLYSNPFYQTVIPAMDHQYAWISSTVDHARSDLNSYRSYGFMVPSGTSHSVVPAGMIFVTASHYSVSNNQNLRIDFAGMNTMIVDQLSPNSNVLSSSLDPRNLFTTSAIGQVETSKALHAILLHRNGPYGHPSWKQIRGSENPVARMQKKLNIFTVRETARIRKVSSSAGIETFSELNGNNIESYIEPAVTQRNKPLLSTFKVKGASEPVAIRHTYGNNLSYFVNDELNKKLGLIGCAPQVYDNFKELYLNSDLSDDNNPIEGFLQLSYSEVVFPKEKNEGRKIIRSRTHYSESAPREKRHDLYGFYDYTQTNVTDFVDIGDYSSNGIDRSPLERRTFWRSSTRDRNRWGILEDHDDPTPSGSGWIHLRSPTTPLVSVLGYRDGLATSVWPFGIETYHTQCYSHNSQSTSRLMSTYGGFDFGDLNPLRGWFNVTHSIAGGTPDLNLGAGDYLNLPLNIYAVAEKPPYIRDGGLDSNIINIERWKNNPTASIMYARNVCPDAMPFYAPKVGFGLVEGLHKSEYGHFPLHLDDFNHRYRTPVLSGKNPWFDSYEEFSKDVRDISKAYSIVPEFNVSEQLDFYVNKNNGNFRTQNDKFLSMQGSYITRSAETENTTLFNEEFFKSFVHTDPLKHLETIIKDHDREDVGINRITLKCNGIKKLLPYNGFYPITRTVQLAQLFSQSYAPNIGGPGWKDGKPDREGFNLPYSSSWSVSALMQPFFAPGILFNTIKSGIAMDFAVVTGSSLITQNEFNNIMGFNYKIPFETIVDLKNGYNGVGLPISSSFSGSLDDSVGNKQILFLAPEVDITSPLRRNYFSWNGNETSPLYRMAMNNFLGETVNFFLENSQLKTISSLPINKMKEMRSGVSYYMDVNLYRTKDILMYGSKWNYLHKFHHSGTYGLGGSLSSPAVPENARLSFTGRFFGFPNKWISTWANGVATNIGVGGTGTLVSAGGRHNRILWYGDAAFAAHLPPYYFGNSTARIKYTADGTEKNQNDPLSYVLSRVVVENLNDNLLDHITFYNTNSVADARKQYTWRDKSVVSSSVNLFGISSDLKVTFNPNNTKNKKSIPISAEESDSKFNRWVISPKMETPILNFADQPQENYKVVFYDGDMQGSNQGGVNYYPISGAMYPIPKGMWSGYGKFCSGSTGIFLGVEESFPDLDISQRANLGSLIDVFGFDTRPQKLGVIDKVKEISECILAIPFVDNVITSKERYAETVRIMGRNFFKVDRKVFDAQKNKKNAGLPVVQGGKEHHKDIEETSITKMIDIMEKYVIPPEMNFLLYEDIPPFVMYGMEFKHLLDQQDLADIWQGVMPKIAMTAEKDEAVFSHDMRPWEFYHGKRIPPSIRWMIFKVKKKAEISYFNKTADSKDDERFKFDFKIGTKAPEYSFNWPYDYCSLVETANMEVQVDITPIPQDIAGYDPDPNLIIVQEQKEKDNFSPSAAVGVLPELGSATKKTAAEKVMIAPKKKNEVLSKTTSRLGLSMKPKGRK